MPATTTCSYPEASRVMTGRCFSGMSAQASGGSTTWPSASTTLCGLVRGPSGLTPAPRAHAGCLQSSRSGRGWRNTRAAFPAAMARSSSSGRCPNVAASTDWVSGHVESACG